MDVLKVADGLFTLSEQERIAIYEKSNTSRNSLELCCLQEKLQRLQTCNFEMWYENTYCYAIYASNSYQLSDI